MRRLFFLGSLPAVALVALFVLPAAAQQAEGPQILVTWKPLTLVPAGYLGRALPTANSRVRASIAVINDGALVDLSGQTIYWYVNDEFVEGSAGKRTIEFRVPDRTNTRVDLRVRLPDYAGGILQTIAIPVLPPQVAIEAPFPGRVVSGPSFSVHATPYFFNVLKPESLVYSWSANGDSSKGAEDPMNYIVDIQPSSLSGSPISIGLSVRHPAALFESAGDTANVVYVKQ